MGLKRGKKTAAIDRHVLYEASVQSTDFELDLVTRIFRAKRKRPLRFLREDFCGTAALAVDWIERSPGNLAIGIDLHKATLDWGSRNHLPRLGKEAHRLRLICDDVLRVSEPKVDAIVAFNYSYQTFKTRELLRAYFENAHRSLTEDGIFVVDVFGGTEAVTELEEEREVPASFRPDGTEVPPFTYIWEQVRFNPIDHHLLCKIHFRLADGREVRNAFRYDWRLWTLPELQELMREAGFRDVEIYIDGWNEEKDEADNVYRRRTSFENIAGWLGYVVGLR
jgi:cyclopropane fatty-acyl-phospholipid synthase-like methyltransferase